VEELPQYFQAFFQKRFIMEWGVARKVSPKAFSRPYKNKSPLQIDIFRFPIVYIQASYSCLEAFLGLF
jgi:hypothetical protein